MLLALLICPPRVALRKESVDRNKYVVQCRKVMGVALRKESVDRNIDTKHFCISIIQSLSARRAWIEISICPGSWILPPVALRKESVDRNPPSRRCAETGKLSLSARRAWIEIWPVAILLISVKVALRKESVDRNGEIVVPRPPIMIVALRKESVDRNIGASYGRTAKIGRSPQGERG